MTTKADNKWKGSIQLLLGLALTLIFFYMMAPFLVVMLLAGVTAIVCYPLQVRLLRYMNRNIASLLLTLLITFGILLPLLFVLYSSIQRLAVWIASLKIPQGGFQDIFNSELMTKVLKLLQKFTPLDEAWIQTQGKELSQLVIEKATRLVTVSLASTPGLLLASFVVIISIFFFLRDGERFLRFLANISPLAPERSSELYHSFEISCRSVVLGIFVSAFAQGLVVILMFLICGLPNPFFFGVISMVLAMVPIVGCTPVWLGGVIYLFAQDQTAWAIVGLVFAVIIGAVDNVVRSYVMGRAEMHPLLALVSVFGAMNLFGATGIFLGPIIAAVFVSFLKILASEIEREKWV